MNSIIWLYIDFLSMEDIRRYYNPKMDYIYMGEIFNPLYWKISSKVTLVLSFKYIDICTYLEMIIPLI